MEALVSEFAAFGPQWLLAGALIAVAAWIAKTWLDEVRAQNVRHAELEAKREERKVEESAERARRDRERSEMEGRIAAQMEQSNHLMEALQKLMETVVTSNELLHSDLVRSQERSQEMGRKVDHIKDRVDLIYDERSSQ